MRCCDLGEVQGRAWIQQLEGVTIFTAAGISWHEGRLLERMGRRVQKGRLRVRSGRYIMRLCKLRATQMPYAPLHRTHSLF